ncbi:hypothetical protein DFP72DRAFT_934593 [Ephemerocybe angulata]|uniref:Nephrocystin 3-like N-terminal domain-containing protein n=1 Tax=Ephemerocybe angulata TaxID=980116 RepID=A0A8H6HBR1_9AGAR|nr:hypothetical protein DFP72DRAFT_934593 [Tulosesus angulatus]
MSRDFTGGIQIQKLDLDHYIRLISASRNDPLSQRRYSSQDPMLSSLISLFWKQSLSTNPGLSKDETNPSNPQTVDVSQSSKPWQQDRKLRWIVKDPGRNGQHTRPLKNEDTSILPGKYPNNPKGSAPSSNIPPKPARHLHEFQTPSHSISSGPSIFHNARDFYLGHFVYQEAQPRSSSSSSSYPWNELVLRHAAPNALFNSNVRVDAPRCDDGARVGVVMGWITDRNAPTNLLFMTGPSGAGKSCLQQTIAERCNDIGILASSFFFWKNDPSRNDVTTIAATMAYQLGLANPNMRALIGEAVDNDPLIFKKALSMQMATLVVNPVKRFRARADEESTRNLPYAILIDALDECQNAEHQLEFLKVLKTSFLDDGDSLFRIFISSRPNHAIHSSLEPPKGLLHELAYQIQLEGNYDIPHVNILQVLWREFWLGSASSEDPLEGVPRGRYSAGDIAVVAFLPVSLLFYIFWRLFEV